MYVNQVDYLRIYLAVQIRYHFYERKVLPPAQLDVGALSNYLGSIPFVALSHFHPTDSTDPAVERIRSYERVHENGEKIVLVYQEEVDIDQMKAQGEEEGGLRVPREQRYPPPFKARSASDVMNDRYSRIRGDGHTARTFRIGARL